MEGVTIVNSKKNKKAFVNGRFITMDKDNAKASTMIVENGLVVDIGGRELLADHSDADVVDLGQCIVLPAFIDSHNHLSIASLVPKWISLEGMRGKDEVLSAIEAHARGGKDGKWVVAFPWFDAEEGGHGFELNDLDNVCPDRPLMLVHGTIHKIMVNTAGLQKLGIDEESPEPEYGRFFRGADGRLNGIIWERAVIPFLDSAFSLDIEEHASLIEERARSLLSFGITAVQDAAVTPAAEAAYRYLHERRRLPLSVLMMPHGDTWLDNCIGSRLDGPRTGEGDALLRVGPIKVFADGGVKGSIAYAGRLCGKDYSTGTPRDDFESTVIEATGKGFRVCIHSIGNVSTEKALSAFEKASAYAPVSFEMRPRIDHLFLLSNEQVGRLARMGGCSSVQPFCIRSAPRYREAPFEGLYWLPYRTLYEGGVALSASSDDPGMASMAFVDPIGCAAIGARMADESSPFYFPEQALPFETWLSFYTAGAAYVGGLENERGTLRKGLVADMVVLEGSLDPDDPPRVKETWKGGEKVFAR